MNKFNVEIKLDTEENLESDFIEGLSELLNDEVGDIYKVSVKEDAKWDELKEWLIQTLKAKGNSPKYYKLNDVLAKMQELEVEDVED